MPRSPRTGGSSRHGWHHRTRSDESAVSYDRERLTRIEILTRDLSIVAQHSLGRVLAASYDVIANPSDAFYLALYNVSGS